MREGWPPATVGGAQRLGRNTRVSATSLGEEAAWQPDRAVAGAARGAAPRSGVRQSWRALQQRRAPFHDNVHSVGELDRVAEARDVWMLDLAEHVHLPHHLTHHLRAAVGRVARLINLDGEAAGHASAGGDARVAGSPFHGLWPAHRLRCLHLPERSREHLAVGALPNLLPHL